MQRDGYLEQVNFEAFMKIVLNTKSLLKDQLQDKYFLPGLIQTMILNNPGQEFIVLTDRADQELYLFDKSVTTLIIRQPVRNSLLRKLWFDFNLPLILKKNKADVFVNCDEFCSLSTGTPQCLLLYDLNLFNHPAVTRRSRVLLNKEYGTKFLKKSDAIVTVSSFLKEKLAFHYKIQQDKIGVVYPPAREIFWPLNEREKEVTKEKYTDAKTYFIYNGDLQSDKNWLNLLKGFSVFKKRQKSNWKLVFTGSPGKNSKTFTESLTTYKFRDDIVLAESPGEEDLVKLTASAYALLSSMQCDRNGAAMLEAMKCHVPVIAGPDPIIKEIAGDAAVYMNPDDPADIAEKIMQLYKDEALRNNLVEKGKDVVMNHSWNIAADVVWQSIQKACIARSNTQKRI